MNKTKMKKDTLARIKSTGIKNAKTKSTAIALNAQKNFGFRYNLFTNFSILILKLLQITTF